ncbi:unnamed protein product [Gordionus sp. m RMFG-2023]|uniref:uncharacterized protein LOC135927252 n=1 Tax=Gordionus sp. m RMFG-2023 TaxID=3053472 RepID=UPI0030DF11E4
MKTNMFNDLMLKIWLAIHSLLLVKKATMDIQVTETCPFSVYPVFKVDVRGRIIKRQISDRSSNIRKRSLDDSIKPPKIICVNERLVAIVETPKNRRCRVRCNDCTFDSGPNLPLGSPISCHIGINQCGTIFNNGFYENDADLEVMEGDQVINTATFKISCPRSKIYTMPKVPIEVVRPPEPMEINAYNAGKGSMDIVLKFQKVFTDKVHFGRNSKDIRCQRNILPNSGMVVIDNIPESCGFRKNGKTMRCDMFLGNPKKKSTPCYVLECPQ